MHRFSTKSFSCAFGLLLALAAAAPAQQIELLDFTSESCPACVQMEPVLRDLAAAGAPVRRVDVNREPELTSRFGVQYLPTFIAVADGREVDRHAGATSADHLRQMLQRAHEASRQGQETRDNGQEAESRLANTSPTFDARRSTFDSAPTPDSQLIASTVRLRVEDPQGISYGTGTIVAASADEAIVLTCGHLFRESQGKLPVQVDLFALQAGSPHVVGSLQGEVISYDLVRDLGFVRFRPDRPLEARPVAPRTATFQPGEKVASVGCDNGDLPSVWRTRVTAIDRYVGPANIEAARSPVQGRSGGGLFSESGELIGVCFAADQEMRGSMSAFQRFTRSWIASAWPRRPTLAASPAAPEATPSRGNYDFASAGTTPQAAVATNAVVAGQDPPSSNVAATRMVPVGNGVTAAPPEQSFTAEEQAALQEIAQRSGGGEVIVIIRPKSPGDRCEIFSLENPSREFINQLTALGTQATHPRFTTHQEVPVRQASVQTAGAAAVRRPNTDRRGIEGWSAVK